MDSSQDFKSLQEKIQSALVAVTRTANRVAAEDLSFQRSSNPAADEQLDDVSERLLDLASSLLGSAAKATELKAPDLEDTDDVDAHWTRIVDVLDTLLEKADTCLDEYTGLVKRKGAPTEESGPQPKKPKSFTPLTHSMRRANILKPQNAFEVKPNNLDPSPWKPRLASKPHAAISLNDSLVEIQGEDQSFQYKHPYEAEITQMRYPDSVSEKREAVKYQPVEGTEATFVDTFEGVLEMLEELKQAKEIAIDTEHHDFRTYTGLLSLMQISTRERDWIVDTLQPWRHRLEVLNEVFADPGIVKVLHGAYMDIIWLQRDCGLYIVGLFDTYEAAVSLAYSGRSLAYLLKRFVDFDADKKYQLADWRLRPIPEEMLYYARSDTHYLLYVYDMMRNELIESSDRNDPDHDLISQVLERSKETSLRRYEKLRYDADSGQGASGWFNLLVKQSAGSLSREQFSVFRAVHQWRDQLARREDESPFFIMSNPTVFNIARSLPPDPKALHSILDTSTSTIAKRSIDALFGVIKKARDEGSTGPSVSEFFRASTVGVGAVAQRTLPRLKAGIAETTVDVKELVAGGSKFWGEVPLSSRWEKSQRSDGPSIAQFALPWASFVENVTISESAPTPLAVRPETQSASGGARVGDGDTEIDSEFTLKAGRKRGAPRSDSDESPDEDETVIKAELSATVPRPAAVLGEEEIALESGTDSDSMHEHLSRTKAGRKERKVKKKAESHEGSLDEDKRRLRAERKAAKREKRARKRDMDPSERKQRDEAAGTENGDGEDEPFDYANAQSVLGAKRGAQNKEGKAKAFNPYSSLTAEGPKPARRMHGEKIGKSATFKSL